MDLSLQEKAELKQLFKSHNISLATVARMTGKSGPQISGLLLGYMYIGQDARQEIVDYAESLRTQEAANGHQSVN